MNVVMYGSSVRVYGEDVRTSKEIPVGTYDVSFGMQTGYSLEKRPDLIPNEEKIYGSTNQKVDKVMKTFGNVGRNLGVILSGHKGCGKSLFVRALSRAALSAGIPVIVVSGCFPGIASFLSSIEQVVMVIFDEFEKTFSHTDEEHDPQNDLLPLFDGMDNGKKLFVITCNDTGLLNNCLLNRPGRFHYHFDVKNPQAEEIEAYMEDNLLPEYKGAIDSVVKLGAMTEVTYDFLRAIAFELNQGYSIEETMQDLNISNTDNVYFKVEVEFDNGRKFTKYDYEMYFNNDRGSRMSSCYVRNYDFGADLCIAIEFFQKDVESVDGKFVLDPAKVRMRHTKYEGDTAPEWMTKEHVKSITLSRSGYEGMTRFSL